MFQALAIAFAMLVSFAPFSVAFQGGDAVAAIQAHDGKADTSFPAKGCSQHGTQCDDDMSMTSHKSECCGVTSPAPVPGPAGRHGTLWRMAMKTVPATSFSPPLRPPSFIA